MTIERAPLGEAVNGPDRLLVNGAGRRIAPRSTGQRHESVSVDARAEIGQLPGQGQRGVHIGWILAGHAEDHVHIDAEALGDANAYGSAHRVDIVAALGRVEYRL